jgi:hypothetical protein
VKAGIVGSADAHGRRLVLVRDATSHASWSLHLEHAHGSHFAACFSRDELVGLVTLLQRGLGLEPTKPGGGGR